MLPQVKQLTQPYNMHYRLQQLLGRVNAATGLEGEPVFDAIISRSFWNLLKSIANNGDNTKVYLRKKEIDWENAALKFRNPR